MDLLRLKEDFDSLDSQNVETLTNNMKIACPILDNGEHVSSSVTESNSDHLKDSEERDFSQSQDNGNENSFDKIARRPVETWKYLPFKTDCNRTSYKCSLCSSVYQHKKSLNKHWKDKHLTNGPSTVNTVPFQERIPSNIINSHQSTSFSGNNVIIYPTVAIKREMYIPQIITVANNNEADHFQNINRKRLSLQIPDEDENKENYPIQQPKRMSLMPMQSLIMRPNRNLCREPMVAETSCNILDLRKPDAEALDLRTSKLFSNESSIKYRCFQCVFHSNNIVELNEHFKHLHVSILLNVKSFCLPVTVYQKLLLNQFTAIVRTESEPLDPFNGPMCCVLCSGQLPSRYDMIQHIGLRHESEMVWVCLVCGFGCQYPALLSHHFRSHEIQLLTRSGASLPPSLPTQPPPQVPQELSMSNSSLQRSTLDFHSPNPHNHLATSTPISKPKRIVSRKDQSTSDSVSGKEKPLKCLVCDATARWRSELFTHMITHSDHRSFGCKFCSYRSKWKWDVPKHLKRCRMAPLSVRKPDVQNSYLITLLQHYSPPPGDILHEFMKQYNIKDIGSLNKPINVKEEEIETREQSSSSVHMERKEGGEMIGDNVDGVGNKYEMISNGLEGDCDGGDEEDDLDVGTDHLFEEERRDKWDHSLKCSFKKCPWCSDFLTNKPSEMSSHLAEHHHGGDMEAWSG